MRIAVISSTVFSVPLHQYGGLEAIAWERAKGLAAKGHKVTLIAPQGSTCPGCEIIEFGAPGQVDERRAYNSYWQKLTQFDCIVDDSWQKWAYIGRGEGWLKAPVLGVMHAPVNTMLNTLPPNVEKPCFVCISKDQAAHFEALFSHPAKVAYNGVDPDFYQPLNVPRSDRFLFVARFSTIKGPSIAIDVCRNAGVGLDLVGDTSITNEPQYLEQCKRKCDGVQIKLVGPASRGNCVWWMSQSRGFLHLAKLFREPFGLAPVEAQLCGNPVLAWDHGALRETVRHGETGFLVKSEGEAVEYLRNGALDNLNRKACREWATLFDVNSMVNRYEELCTEAIETGGW